MLVYTEFSSVDAVHTGDRRLFKDFFYDESQRPVIAQIYGRTPENFRQTAILLCQRASTASTSTWDVPPRASR